MPSELRPDIATGIRRTGDPRSVSKRLLDRRESFVLADQRVDLRVLVIQRQREAGGLAPDGLVLRSGEPDRIGASRVSTFAQVRVHRTLEPVAAIGVIFGPLVDLTEDRLVDGFLSPPISHQDSRRRHRTCGPEPIPKSA